jgi:hypothetical protein
MPIGNHHAARAGPRPAIATDGFLIRGIEDVGEPRTGGDLPGLTMREVCPHWKLPPQSDRGLVFGRVNQNLCVDRMVAATAGRLRSREPIQTVAAPPNATGMWRGVRGGAQASIDCPGGRGCSRVMEALPGRRRERNGSATPGGEPVGRVGITRWQ